MVMMPYKVSTVTPSPKGDRYLSNDAFIARTEWCEANCPDQYESYMGYFAFKTQNQADAFRNAFGVAK
jgi:hypothetical protein